MSSSRMASKPFMFLTTLLLWTTLSTVATAQQQSPRIPSEITDFVPSCARDCFRSFITANFGSSGCGNSPSLQCLCTKTGASGYTLGEGAFSCSVAERDRGNCKGADADSGVPLGAYNMCSRVPNAARATHDTIVATLIIPSGTGGLVVPTAAPTTAPSTSSISTTFAASTSSTPTSTSVSTSTSTPAESSQAAAITNSPPRLSAPQIAGISLGVIAGVVAFGVLLIFLARCVRRRRFGDQDTEAGFAKMRDSMSYGHGSNQGSPPALHGGLQISNPIRKPTVEMDFQRPVEAYKPYRPHQQPTEWQQQTPPEPVHPGMIGIAISPKKTVVARSSSNSATTAAVSPAPIVAPPAMILTPPSRSNTLEQIEPSPPKPSLTLAIPKGRAPIAGSGTGAGNGNGNGNGAAGARDSVVTEFAEDGEGESNPNTSSIWRPPPTDPQSASTYYFADKGGNWILRRTSTTTKKKPNAANRTPISPQIEELPSPDDRTRAERAAQDFPMVAPLRLSKTYQQPQLGSPINFKDQSRTNRSSSVYASNNVSVAAAPIPPSDTYYAMMRDGRNLTGSKLKQQQQQQQQQPQRPAIPTKSANRRVSYQSSTSIESGAAGGPFDDYDDEDIIENEPQVSLSPVAQSPNTPLEGRSPVSYPKIPKNGGSAFSLFPSTTSSVPTTTANSSRDTSRSPLQASPTLGGGGGAAQPPRSVNKNKRLLYPGGLGLPANPNPNRNPGQVRTGSPETRLGVFPTAVPTPNIAELPAQPARRPSPAAKQQQQQGLGISAAAEQRPQPYPYQYHTQQELQQQQQQQQQQQMYRTPSPAQQQRPRAAPAPQQPQAQVQVQVQPQQQQQKRYPTPPQQQQQPSPAAATGAGAGAGAGPIRGGQSSLLAKRLGAEKAAALSLGGSDSNSRPSRRDKWTRESFGPQKPAQNNTTKGGQPVGGGDDDLPYPIPVTPGWIPQLTPTKRGDDLYLNVQ